MKILSYSPAFDYKINYTPMKADIEMIVTINYIPLVDANLIWYPFTIVTLVTVVTLVTFNLVLALTMFL